jgi:hypothetical protein
MAATPFIENFVESEGISGPAERVLESLNVRSEVELFSVLSAFPSLGRSGVLDLPGLSNVLMSRGGDSVRSFAVEAPGLVEQAHSFSLGALPPPDTEWTFERTFPIPPAGAGRFGERIPPSADGSVDLRACLPWPVRDQARRGTGVSFAVTALREALECQTESRISDLSEQFLYYVIKNHTRDPRPNDDGTWLEYACAALLSHGTCEERFAPYNPNEIPGSAGQGKPFQAAFNDAIRRVRHAATLVTPNSPAGNAKQVLQELRSTGRPVAIAVPVFFDPITQANNWGTAVGVLHGHVIDPVPTSVVRGGHAVCVTGFVPDPQEATGGYFVLRNSWGPLWGRSLPDPNYFGPEVGYGQISATYVDRFLWQYCRL